jgi:hypothetical protein
LASSDVQIDDGTFVRSFPSIRHHQHHHLHAFTFFFLLLFVPVFRFSSSFVLYPALLPTKPAVRASPVLLVVVYIKPVLAFFFSYSSSSHPRLGDPQPDDNRPPPEHRTGLACWSGKGLRGVPAVSNIFFFREKKHLLQLSPSSAGWEALDPISRPPFFFLHLRLRLDRATRTAGPDLCPRAISLSRSRLSFVLLLLLLLLLLLRPARAHHPQSPPPNASAARALTPFVSLRIPTAHAGLPTRPVDPPPSPSPPLPSPAASPPTPT